MVYGEVLERLTQSQKCSSSSLVARGEPRGDMFCELEFELSHDLKSNDFSKLSSANVCASAFAHLNGQQTDAMHLRHGILDIKGI